MAPSATSSQPPAGSQLQPLSSQCTLPQTLSEKHARDPANPPLPIFVILIGWKAGLLWSDPHPCARQQLGTPTHVNALPRIGPFGQAANPNAPPPRRHRGKLLGLLEKGVTTPWSRKSWSPIHLCIHFEAIACAGGLTKLVVGRRELWRVGNGWGGSWLIIEDK